MKNFYSSLCPAFVVLALISMSLIPDNVSGQDNTAKAAFKARTAQNEFPTGNYVPSPSADHPRSPAYHYRSTFFSITQVNVDDNGYNILYDAGNEPSITYNPNDPNSLAIGWRQFDDVGNNFRQAGNAFTNDGGETWIFPGVIDPGIFRSDPVLRCDRDGNFYYNSLTSNNGNYSCNVYLSSDGGEIWEMGTFAQGGDKQWMSIDMTQGQGSGNIYAFWNSSYSACPPHGFTRSTDHNVSYPDCWTVQDEPIWGTTFVGPDGMLYLSGASWTGFLLVRSTNAQDPAQDVTWDFSTSVYLDGDIVGFGGYSCPNPEGLLGQTQVAMDSTGGPGDGNIYLLCSVSRQSNGDPCDVMFARSTDGGHNFDWPVRVNDDPSNNAYQWFGTMSVAPDGRIDVIWLDTRDNTGQVLSALYYSYSLDQGTTWSQNVKLSDSFDPWVGWPQQNKMGDYYDMYSDDAGAHLAWSATFNNEQDVYYSVIKPDYQGISDPGKLADARLSISYPNPFRDMTTIRYQVPETEKVTLKIFTSSGTLVETLVDEVKTTGVYYQNYSAPGLNSGVYYYRFEAGNRSETGRMTIVR